MVKGNIVPSSLGKWPVSSMNGLQCPGGLGSPSACHLALCPTVLDPATKASLILTCCFLGEQ